MRHLIVVLFAVAALLLWYALVGAQPKLSLFGAAASDAGLIDWARRWLPVPSLAHR